MLVVGYFLVDRKILKYFTKPYSETEAWIWMISQANFIKGEHYGQISTTIRQLGDIWGWNKMKVARTLNKWSNPTNARISCKYASFPRQTKKPVNHVTETVTVRVTEDVTKVTTITLLNYKHYQNGKQKTVTGGVTEDVTQSGTLLKEEENQVKQKEPTKKNTRSPKGDRVVDSRIKVLIDFFHDTHVKIQGEKPHIFKGDGQAIQRLLTTYREVEELKRRIIAYLNDPHEWMGTPVWSIARFEKEAGKYSLKNVQRQKGGTEEERPVLSFDVKKHLEDKAKRMADRGPTKEDIPF